MRQAIDLLNKIAEDVNIDDHSILANIAKTSMEPKIVSVDSDVLSDLAVRAIFSVAEKPTTADQNGNNHRYLVVDLDNVKMQKKPGGAMADSTLDEGIIIDKEVAHSEMPKKTQDAKILLLNSSLEIEKTEFDAKISIDRPEQMAMFLQEESKMLRAMTEKIISVGANIVFCRKGIDDTALDYLAQAGISAVKRVKESDLAALAKATGAWHGRLQMNLKV